MNCPKCNRPVASFYELMSKAGKLRCVAYVIHEEEEEVRWTCHLNLIQANAYKKGNVVKRLKGKLHD